MKIVNNQLNKAYRRYNLNFIYDTKVKLTHRDIEKIWWCIPSDKKDTRVVVLSNRVAVLRRNDNIYIEFHSSIFDFLIHYSNNLKMFLKLDLD